MQKKQLGGKYVAIETMELWTDIAVAIAFLWQFALPFAVKTHYKGIYDLKYEVRNGYFYWTLLLAPLVLAPIFLQFILPRYPATGNLPIVVLILTLSQQFEKLYVFKEGVIINGTYYYWEEIEGYRFVNRKLTIKAKKRKWSSFFTKKNSWEIENSRIKIVAETFKKHLPVIEM